MNISKKILTATFALALFGAPAFATPPEHARNESSCPNPHGGPEEADPDNPYGSTCDGSESGNGNGDGNANGRPCAGCVGNADNQNPPGQTPGPQDSNNGYECDGNSGVGQGNPAHSGCEPTETPTEPSPTPTEPTETPTTPAPTEPTVTPTTPVPTEPTTTPTEPTATPTVPSETPTAPVESTPPGELPATGSDALLVLVYGLSMLGIGGAALKLTSPSK